MLLRGAPLLLLGVGPRGPHRPAQPIDGVEGSFLARGGVGVRTSRGLAAIFPQKCIHHRGAPRGPREIHASRALCVAPWRGRRIRTARGADLLRVREHVWLLRLQARASDGGIRLRVLVGLPREEDDETSSPARRRLSRSSFRLRFWSLAMRRAALRPLSARRARTLSLRCTPRKRFAARCDSSSGTRG